jgi:hypothetical protein
VYLALVAQSLEGSGRRDGDGRRLIECEVCRLGRQLVFACAGVLGEGAFAGTNHLIARPEPGHSLADRLDPSG